MKTYSELILLPTFEERFEYLKIGGTVGAATFGGHRYLNQGLYRSGPWRSFRDKIITRDLGCDLACKGFEIFKFATVHHINPITIEMVMQNDPLIFDPENAITTTDRTHKAIHYGDADLLTLTPIERQPYDTCPWRQTS